MSHMTQIILIYAVSVMAYIVDKSCDRHLGANDVDCMHSRHLEPSGSTADAQCEQCRSDLLSAVHFWSPPDAEGGLLWCTQFDG